MGLIYIFPVDENETDRVSKSINLDSITLKTYGLPMVFWVYLAAIYIVVFTMWLTIHSALDKLLSYDDTSMVLLYWLVQGTLLLGPVILLGFFFFEKFITKSKNKLTLTYRLFFIPIFRKSITLDSFDSLTVDHFMDSPNIAKMKSDPTTKGFENKGHFELHAISNGKSIFVDRHSRKSDLTKLKDLLLKF